MLETTFICAIFSPILVFVSTRFRALTDLLTLIRKSNLPRRQLSPVLLNSDCFFQLKKKDLVEKILSAPRPPPRALSVKPEVVQ